MKKNNRFLRMAAFALVGVLLCGSLCACTEKEDTLVTDITSGEYVYTRSENTGTARISRYKGVADELVIPQLLDNLPVVGIEKNAFAENKTLKQVTLPSTVEWIEAGAFKNCEKLTTVKTGETLKSIGSYAFSGCVSLSAISLPDTLETIGNNAFFGCAALENVLLGKNITSVGVDAFYGTQWFASLKDEFVIVGDGVLIDYNGKGGTVTIPDTVKHIAGAFVDNSVVKKVILPQGMTQVDKDAFRGCMTLAAVEIPDSVTVIEEYAFSRCSSLTKVTLPQTLTEIKSNAFSGCVGLLEAVIPEKVTVISENAFSECRALSSVTFTKKLSEIQKDAFAGCGAINVVAYSGTKSDWEKVRIADGNEALANALLNCKE